MADNVIIQLDLDTSEYTKKLTQVEKDLDKVSKSEAEIKIKSSLETKQIDRDIVSISESVKMNLNQSFTSFTKSANGQILKVTETISQSFGATVSKSIVDISASTEKLNTVNKDASKSLEKLGSDFSKLNNGIEKTNSSVGGLNEKLSTTQSTASSIGSFFTAIFTPISLASSAIAAMTYNLQTLGSVVKVADKVFGVFYGKSLKDSQIVEDVGEKFGITGTKIAIAKLKLADYLRGNEYAMTSFRELGQTVGFNTEKIEKNAETLNNVESALKKIAAGGLAVYLSATIRASKVTSDYVMKMQQFQAGFKAGLSAPGDIAKSITNFTNGIFGLVKALAVVGSSLALFGQMMRESDSQVVRVAGVISTALGFALAGISYSLVIATQKVGEFVLAIGTKGVQAFVSFTKTFSEFEKSNLIFVRTIEGFNQAYGNQIGNLDSWESRIKSISEATGISAIQLRTAVSELVASGAQFGLNEQQLSKLLNVVVDYSSITGDVTQTTIDFVSALQGSSQSVLKYGIKVNEAAIEHELANQGIKRSISSLNDMDLMYLRLGKIMKIHSVIEGKAVAVSQTLSGQQQVLNTNLERVNAQIGLGASYIENYNVVALAANTVLNSLNDTFLSMFGFLGALASRILQVIGIMLKWAFTVYGVISAFSLLDMAMKSNLVQTAMGKSIPLLNVSFIDLIKSTGIATVNLNSASGAIKTFGLVTVQSFKQLTAMALGVTASTLTMGVAFRALATKGIAIVVIASKALWAAFAALATNPFVLIAAGLAAAIYGIYRAMVFLETKTGVVSAAWNVLKGVFAQGASVLAPFIGWLNKLADAAITVGAIFAGYFIDKIAGAFQFIAGIVKSNPFNVFAKDTVEQMGIAEGKIIALRIALGKAGFDIRKVAGDIAKIQMEKPMGLSPDNGEDAKIKKVKLYQERIFTLGEVNRTFWDNQRVLTQRFRDDSATALDASSADFQRVAKIIVEGSEDLAMRTREALVDGVGDSVTAMGAAFVTAGETGQSGLETLGRGLLSTLGDIFIMMGKQLVAFGLGMSLVPGIFGLQGPMAVVAGGAMMVAGGALKAFAGKGASAPAGGAAEASAGSGSTKTPGDLTSLQDVQRVEPMTNVTVNVSGVVTDPRGTAKQIADILKGGFKTNGINTRMITV